MPAVLGFETGALVLRGLILLVAGLAFLALARGLPDDLRLPSARPRRWVAAALGGALLGLAGLLVASLEASAAGALAWGALCAACGALAGARWAMDPPG